VNRLAVVLLGLSLLAPSADVAAQPAGKRYFDIVDTDGDGRVRVEEYVERMSYAFRRMDADGDGVLRPEEQLSPKAPTTTFAELRARLEAQFRRQDRDGDGGLDLKEFLAPPA